MKKKVIRLTEQDLHRIVKESVRKIIKEAGDTNRGQYLLGRLRHRQANSGGISDNNAMDYAYKSNGNSFSDAYREGFEDEGRFQARANDGGRKIVKNGYMEKKMEDMDILGKKFIDFIEKYHGGVLLQTIVDFESGNETGTETSPLPTIIPEFEDAVLGYKCTPEMRQAIKNAYNNWWHYAQDELLGNDF